jgi:tyrosinase
MSGGFSPNDPIFFLHHANVDRLWAHWQTQRLAAVPGSTPENHYPPPTQLSPFDGDPAPLGHRLNDAMWPWIGTTPGFDADVDTAVRQLLPDFTDRPPSPSRTSWTPKPSTRSATATPPQATPKQRSW